MSNFEQLIKSSNESRKLKFDTELTKPEIEQITEKLHKRMKAILTLRKHRKFKGSSLAQSLREEMNIKTALADISVSKVIYVNNNFLCTPRTKVAI